MPKISKRKISISSDKPLKLSKLATDTATDTAKPSTYIMRKASTIAAMRYPLGNESAADLLYLAFLAGHAVKHTLDCVALRTTFPQGVPAGTYGNQTVAVNAGRIIRLVKLGYATITSGTDQNPLALAFTEKAQSVSHYTQNYGKAS